MKPRTRYQLPPDKEQLLRRAVRLQWLSLALLTSVIVVMAFAMGSSQAMRTAWIEDLLSLIPPIAFLIAVRVRRKPPDARYPYGRHRVMSIAFLVAATALLAFGLSLLADAVASLVRGEHPTIGFVDLFGRQVWLGWIMIATLAYSVVPPIVLGRLKLPLGRALHAKVLHTDASMNKADWLTGLAAIGGILGIGMGFWWADAAAAGMISWSIVADGVRALRTVVADLMDRAPRPVDENDAFDVFESVSAYFERLDWVEAHALRLREEGDVCVGEVYVVVKPETLTADALTRAIERAVQEARALDFRLYDLAVMPVPSLDGRPTPHEA